MDPPPLSDLRWRIRNSFRNPVLRILCSFDSFDRWALRRSIQELRDLDDLPLLEAIKTYDGTGFYSSTFPKRAFLQQDLEAFEVFHDHVQERDPNVVLELGSGNGGSLYAWARGLDADLVVSVDVAHPKRTPAFYDAFDPSTTVRCVTGWTTDPTTLEETQAVLGDRSVDFLYLDASHDLEGVLEEVTLYAPLLSVDGFVGIHDVRSSMGVSKAWTVLSRVFPSRVVGENGVLG